jgi:hypothetical protein
MNYERGEERGICDMNLNMNMNMNPLRIHGRTLLKYERRRDVDSRVLDFIIHNS